MNEDFDVRSLDGEELLDMVEQDLSDAIRHGVLISCLASALARELNESKEAVEKIALAGMLHDIGKLRLSKYLYGRKKDILVIEEMKYVRMHPTFSKEISEQHGYDKEIQEMVYHHHENYDGSGYPDNLKGRSIPWGARILRVCDVFGALVSKRPYRGAFEVDTAMEMMIDEVKNFDMKIFLAFQRVVFSEEFSKIQSIIDYCNKEDMERTEWTELFKMMVHDGLTLETNESKR